VLGGGEPAGVPAWKGFFFIRPVGAHRVRGYYYPLTPCACVPPPPGSPSVRPPLPAGSVRSTDPSRFPGRSPVVLHPTHVRFFLWRTHVSSSWNSAILPRIFSELLHSLIATEARISCPMSQATLSSPTSSQTRSNLLSLFEKCSPPRNIPPLRFPQESWMSGIGTQPNVPEETECISPTASQASTVSTQPGSWAQQAFALPPTPPVLRRQLATILSSPELPEDAPQYVSPWAVEEDNPSKLSGMVELTCSLGTTIRVMRPSSFQDLLRKEQHVMYASAKNTPLQLARLICKGLFGSRTPAQFRAFVASLRDAISKSLKTLPKVDTMMQFHIARRLESSKGSRNPIHSQSLEYDLYVKS